MLRVDPGIDRILLRGGESVGIREGRHGGWFAVEETEVGVVECSGIANSDMFVRTSYESPS